jgi:hypothetical protein
MSRPRGLVLAAAVFVLAFPAAAAHADRGPKGRVSVNVDATGRRVALTYAPKQRVIEQKVRLNGTHLEDAFRDAPPAGRKLVLGLDEGLQFGPNKLTVRNLYPDGKVVKRVRHFRVDDVRPIAGITGDNDLHDGVPMLLRARTAPPGASNAERSRFNRHQGNVRLNWTILDRPDGAKAKLRHRHAKQPRFVPDQPGIYRVGLTVTRTGADGSPKGPTASRTMERMLLVDSSQASKAGVFIGTEPLDDTTQGTPTDLRIFGGSSAGTYPIGAGNGQAGPIVNLLFDRCTLTQIGDPLYIDTSTAGVNELTAALISAVDGLQQSGCSLMVVTAGADYGTIGPLGPALDIWTGQATENFAYEGNTNPFWAVWSPAPMPLTAVGKGHGVSNYPYFDGTSPAGRMAGELVPDQNGNYVFRRSTTPAFGVQNTELKFSMDQTGITLPQQGGAPAKFPAGSPGCPGTGQGGFQLVVVGASGEQVLDLIGLTPAQVNGQSVGNGDTFWVNGCTAADGAAYAAALRQVLGQVGTSFNDYPTMIFLQGVGKALPPPAQMTDAETQDLRAVAAMIGDMGGSGGAFLNNEAATSGPGYSFAGQSWPLPGGARSGTEVSSSTPSGPPAQLDGFVRPDQISRLAPAIATSAAAQLGPDIDDYRATQTASAIVHPELSFTTEQYPGAGSQGWQNAMYYLSKNVFDPTLVYNPTDACYAPKMDANWVVYDVRSMYCGGGGGTDCQDPWDTYSSSIAPGEKGSKYVAGNGFSESTWNDVLPQLQTEFSMIENLNCNTASFQLASGTVGSAGDIPVSQIVQATNGYIKKEFAKISDIDAIVGDALEIVASLSNVLAVGANVKGNDFATNVFWGIQGGIDLAEAFNSLGFAVASYILEPLPPNTTATAYASAIQDDLQAASGALVAPRDQIASDWGRLQSYNAAGLLVQANDVRSVESALKYGTYDRVWRQILPSTFVPVHLKVTGSAGESPPYDVPSYQCVNDPSNNEPGTSQPFQGFPADSYTLYPEGPTADNPSGLEAYVLAGTYYSGFLGTHFYQPIPPPDSEVLSQLFSPMADTDRSNPQPVVNGQATPLGINKDQFFADVIESARAASPPQVLDIPSSAGFCPYP